MYVNRRAQEKEENEKKRRYKNSIQFRAISTPFLAEDGLFIFYSNLLGNKLILLWNNCGLHFSARLLVGHEENENYKSCSMLYLNLANLHGWCTCQTGFFVAKQTHGADFVAELLPLFGTGLKKVDASKDASLLY